MLFYDMIKISWVEMGYRDGISYVYTPEFLYGVECDNLLQEVVPVVILGDSQHHKQNIKGTGTCLSTWWLGEPESPFVHQWMLDVEIVFVMEDSDGFVRALSL